MLTLITRTSIIAITLVFAAGALIEAGNGFGWVLLALGAGWLGIVQASLETVIRELRREGYRAPDEVAK